MILYRSRKIRLLIFTLFFGAYLYGQSVNFDWAKNGVLGSGSFSTSVGSALLVNDAGNIYVTGTFQDTADFDPGAGVVNLIAEGVGGGYLQKLDDLGNLIWVKTFAGTGSSIANAIVEDSSGNIFLAGHYNDSVDFDPNGGNYFLESSAFADGFIMKLDSNGTFVWVKTFEGTYSSTIKDISISENGEVYLVGDFSGTTDFDPGTGVFNVSGNDADAFTVKLDSQGNFIWVKTFPLIFNDVGNAIDLDTNQNIVIVGDIAFGGGFIKKIDPNGLVLWEKEFTLSAVCNDIVIDSNNDIVVCGFYENTADFDPSTGVYDFNTFSVSNGFTAKLDENGDFIWAQEFGGGGEDEAKRVAIDSQNNIIVCGAYQFTVDFNFGPVVNNLNGLLVNGFLQKLGPQGDFLWAKSIGTGSSNYFGNDFVVDNNNNIYVTGGYRGAIDFDPSSDIYTISPLSIPLSQYISKYSDCTPIQSVDTFTGCDSVTWIDGITYSTDNHSALFNVLSGASDGCDSIVTLNLSIENSSSGTDSIFACNEYTWIDGNTYTAPNNSTTFILMNSVGCDSVVTLNIDFDYVSTDVTVINELSFEANETNAQYQWLDCDANNNFSPIPGATGKTFSTVANGGFAVKVTKGSCTDTSDCIFVTTVGLDEEAEIQNISIFPNPTQGAFTIISENSLIDYVKIYNLAQELVYKNSEVTNNQQIVLKVASGLYTVEIEINGKLSRHKLMFNN